MKKIQNFNPKGFTIIELLVATSIFSAILLVLTQVVIRLSGTYYHGVIQNQTLNVAKNITNNIVQQIQFTGGDIIFPPNPTNWSSGIRDPQLLGHESYLCIGSNQYVYQLGGRFDNVSAKGALALSYNPQCSNVGPQIQPNNKWDFRGNISSNYYVDLIPQGMRLAIFQVSPQFGDLYKVEVMVAYGADGDGSNGSGYDSTHKKCYTGSYYCATTDLVTYVEKTVH